MCSRPREEREREMDAYMKPEAPLETDAGHLDAGHVCFSAIPRAATPPLVVAPATSGAVEEPCEKLCWGGRCSQIRPAHAGGPPAEQAVQEVEMLSKLQREAEAGMRSLRKGPKAESRAAGALEQSMAAQRPLTQRQSDSSQKRSAAAKDPGRSGSP